METNPGQGRIVEKDIYCVQILDKYLLYVPPTSQGCPPLAALVNRAAAMALQEGTIPEGLANWFGQLSRQEVTPNGVRSAPALEPFFLGLIPTRGCNLACRYCNFDAPKRSSPRMSLPVARAAIDGYLRLLEPSLTNTLEVHFFGGEPFYAWDTVFFAVEYARLRAAELGMDTHFEVITNGVFSSERCRWIASHFDAVVLSLDGPPDLQAWQRPAADQRQTAPIVEANARLLSDGPCELSLRTCVTQESVHRMPEVAAYFLRNFSPAGVCFEMLVPSPSSERAGLRPPDAYTFAKGYLAARSILAEEGIEAVVSTVNLHSRQSSFCPVGKDALIVSPDGAIDACYLLREDWEQNRLDLRLGHLEGSEFSFLPGAVQRARDLTGRFKEGCRDCLCLTHCAGGCHVRRSASAHEQRIEEVCTHTRLITIASILFSLGEAGLVEAWMSDPSAIRMAALSATDRLMDVETG